YNNRMVQTKTIIREAGLAYSPHAIAVTTTGSGLDRLAIQQGWLNRFPMWDWVGGRTSELSAVGLLHAAVQGFNIDSMLSGARACDEITRVPQVKSNPSAQLALAW